MSGNVITGVIPAQIRNLRTLEELDLGSNYLRGVIPAFLGDLTNLEQLFLGSNLFTGTIPPKVARLAKAKKFDMSYNDLTGPIPPFTGRLLEFLDLVSLFVSLLFERILVGFVLISLFASERQPGTGGKARLDSWKRDGQHSVLVLYVLTKSRLLMPCCFQ